MHQLYNASRGDDTQFASNCGSSSRIDPLKNVPRQPKSKHSNRDFTRERMP